MKIGPALIRLQSIEMEPFAKMIIPRSESIILHGLKLLSSQELAKYIICK